MLTNEQKLELITKLIDIVFEQAQTAVNNPTGDDLVDADLLIDIYASGYEAIEIALNA